MKEDQQLSVEKLDAAIKNAHGWKNISDMSTKDNELLKSENKKLKKEILLLIRREDDLFKGATFSVTRKLPGGGKLTS